MTESHEPHATDEQSGGAADAWRGDVARPSLPRVPMQRAVDRDFASMADQARAEADVSRETDAGDFAPDDDSPVGKELWETELLRRELEDADFPRPPRTRIITAHAICGFANFGSMGILIGGLSIIEPDRRDDFLSLAWRTLLAGTLATCLSGAVVGALPYQLFAGAH